MTLAGFEVRHYGELDSTNEEAKRLLASDEIRQTVIIRADCQTAGKGTQGRQWISPAGAGLYFSIVHPFEPLSQTSESNMAAVPLTPLFTLAAGVACAETLVSLTGLTIQLKPINDLYVEDRKLGGILTESLISENRCRALITGIGINIRQNEAIQAGCEQDNRGNHPTSLQHCIAPYLFSQWHLDALLEELSQTIALAVHAQYQQLMQGEAEALLANYLRYKLPEMDLPLEIQTLLAECS